MNVADIVIDPEFRVLIDALSSEELNGLKDDIEADGRILSPLIVWGNILIDGHNRLDIWKFLGNLPEPPIEQVEFSSREEAMSWMISHQLHRRNMSEARKKYLIGKRYNLEKSKPDDNLVPGGKSSMAQIEPSRKQGKKRQKSSTQHTAKRIAKETQASVATIKRSGKFTEAIDTIRGTDAGFAGEVLSGKLKVPESAIVAMGNLDGRGIAAAIKKIRDGDKPEASTASVVLDALKRDVPSHLSDDFAAAAPINSAANKLDSIRRDVETLATERGGQFIPLSEIVQKAKELKGLIAQSRYHTECPRCCGTVNAECKRCDGNGFIPFSRRGLLSSEEKEWLGEDVPF